MEWDDHNTLRCTKCGEIIAMRYVFENEVRIYVFKKFRKFKPKVKAFQEVCFDSKDGAKMDGVRFIDFDNILCDLELGTNYIFPMEEDAGGVREDWEGCDATGTIWADEIEEEM